MELYHWPTVGLSPLAAAFGTNSFCYMYQGVERQCYQISVFIAFFGPGECLCQTVLRFLKTSKKSDVKPQCLWPCVNQKLIGSHLSPSKRFRQI